MLSISKEIIDVQEFAMEVDIKANDVMIWYHLSGYPIAHTLEMSMIISHHAIWELNEHHATNTNTTIITKFNSLFHDLSMDFFISHAIYLNSCARLVISHAIY